MFHIEIKKYLIAAIVVFGLIAILIFINTGLHYSDLQIVEPESLSGSRYIELEPHSIVVQKIKIERDSFFDNIKLILINLDEQSKDGHLFIKLRKDGNDLKEIEYPIVSAVAGEWFEIPIGKRIYKGEYELEISMLSNEGVTVPYLVTMGVTDLLGCNIELELNGEPMDDSVAISYQLYGIPSMDIMILINVLAISLAGGVLCVVFRRDYFTQYANIIIPVILVLSVLPVIVICKYSRPCVDDFAYSADVYKLIKSGDHNIGHILRTAYEVDKHFYQTWQGLYVSAFVLALQPGVLGEKNYYWGTIVLLLFIYASLYLTIWIIKKRLCTDKKNVWLWSLVFFTVIVQGLPSAVEGLFWFNGAYNYMPFVFLTMINMVLLLEYCCQNKWRKNICIGVSCILSFVISGGNHVTAFLDILCLLLACVILLRRRKPLVLLSLGMSLFGFWIMYRAPGTAIRQNALPKSTLLETVFNSGIQTFESLNVWINLQYICYLLLLLPFIMEIVKSYKKRLKYHPMLIVFASVIILAGMYCVPYYASSYFGAGRLINVVWITFLILSVLDLTYVLAWIDQSAEVKNIGWNAVSVFLCLAICFFGCGKSSTAVRAVDELSSGVAQRFAAGCDKRYEMMEGASKDEVLYFDRLEQSELLKFSDITEDAGEWQNNHWTAYYGIRVALKP